MRQAVASYYDSRGGHCYAPASLLFVEVAGYLDSCRQDDRFTVPHQPVEADGFSLSIAGKDTTWRGGIPFCQVETKRRTPGEFLLPELRCYRRS